MNHVWAYDFVFDTCADGRSLKCLTVVDEFTRECLAIDVAGSIRSGRVIDVLGQEGAETHVRTFFVVVSPPAFDPDLGLHPIPKPLEG